MGAGIARHLAASGLQVLLLDSSEPQLATARANCTGFDITCTTNLADLSDRDFVIEAVFEDLDVKHSVLSAACAIVRDDCILATNTSSLLVSDIATAVTHPGRFLGVHYNNPADMNPVLEVIATDNTAPEVETRVFEWYRDAGKLTVRCADTSGFILNRQSLPYINAAARCLDIATPGEIDRVATSSLGVGLGPFAVMNLVGLAVMAAASRNLSVLGDGYEAAESLQRRAEAAAPEWEIEPPGKVSEALSAEITERLLAAMIFPGKDILDRGLCSREDLHMICIEALGYRTSSPELLEQLSTDRVDALLGAHLARSVSQNG